MTREIVSLLTDKPHPAPTSVFGPPADDDTLPALALDPLDPAAGFLANLGAGEPVSALEAIQKAINSRQIKATIEVKLRQAQALIAAGDQRASSVLNEVRTQTPGRGSRCGSGA